MILRVLLLLVVFALFIVWVDYLNPGNVNLMLPGDITVVPSKIALMLGSAAFGALVVLLGIYIKATTDFFQNWKRARGRQKRGGGLVRGDSALVPPEIVPLGYAADSTHWYINLWQDETSTAGGGRAMPATQASLCQLKDLYR